MEPCTVLTIMVFLAEELSALFQLAREVTCTITTRTVLHSQFESCLERSNSVGDGCWWSIRLIRNGLAGTACRSDHLP